MKRPLPIVAGLLLVLLGLLSLAGPIDRGLWLGADGPAPAAVSSPTPIATGSATPAPTPSATPGPSPTPDPLRPIPDGYRIRIPRLAIDLPIAEGNIVRDIEQQRTPESYAFHLPGTAIPEQGSNTYLYAHARTGMFLTLWNARVGDAVVISTPDGKALHYVVSEVHPTVVPTDVSWAQATPGERLTLQTSTGPNPGDPRFVVVALPAP